MEIEITFPGGQKVDAAYQNFNIRTDQSEKSGGEGSAPEPYLCFLASIGTCAGVYVLRFCESRRINTDGLKIIQTMSWDDKTKRLEEIGIDIQLPPDFPAKYEKAVVRAAELCAVKKTILDPPAFNVTASR